MDSLTAHYVARELDARWRGRRVKASKWDRDLRQLAIAVEGADRSILFDLSTPEVSIRESTDLPEGRVIAGWTVRAVSAPVDDRRLVVELTRSGRFRGSAERRAALEVSLVPSARGAMLRDDGGRQLAALGTALPPRVAPRPELTPEELIAAARGGDAESLLRGRWTSAAVARWLLSDPGSIVERYRALCALPEPRPSRCGSRLLPLPLCDDAEEVSSLIETPPTSAPARDTASDRRTRALQRMQSELDRAAAAPRLREVADALMSLGDGPPPGEVTIGDGSRERVSARPGESARATAERLYGEVRAMERALATLPARIWALAKQPRESREGARTVGRHPAAGHHPARPYRRYRSSGGIEIWVGRGAKSNDQLTFRESSPDDVWLHARDAAGAHVVLRWQRDEPPPARDLEEAATLAAWHSKARGSAVVPVDWTRRKYVRKPRGGAPGLVLVQRSETVFARPDGNVERQLRLG
jgi:NFACT protein RNA binding domain